MEDAASCSVSRFDGTADFRVWRARVENELMRYHLLGYVMVRGYDGSQSFTFDGEEVPPRCPVINVDGDQALVKEEATCGHSAAAQESCLTRWEVLRESADAKSILQRYLHPDVECAILNKNIYDSWKMLCALYGNRSSPGAHDVYEMHRVLHHIRLGDKKGEPVREFITRWDMLMQQYALATGIELTDGFRSVSLVQTLPSAWRSMVAAWRGIRPFVPYAELVEKVIATREQKQAQAETTSTAPSSTALARDASSAGGSPIDGQVGQLPKKSVGRSASINPVKQTPAKPSDTTTELGATKQQDNPVRNQEKRSSQNPDDTPAEKRAAEAPSTDEATKASKSAPSPIATADNTVDLTRGEVSSSAATGSNKAFSSTHSQDKEKKSPADKTGSPRSSKSWKDDKRRDQDDVYEQRSHNGKHDTKRGYDRYTPHSRYDKVSHKPYSKLDKKYDSLDSKHGGPVSCFYCLKVGHHMKRCWYLKADIENGTTHDTHKKFSCAITIDRNQFMVNCLEAYIDEETRARAGDDSVSESVGRLYSPRQQQFVPAPPPGDPPSYAFRDQQQASRAPRKRSHSVFQSAEGRLSSRSNRSRSVFRGADKSESFSPRKRSRAPSFERPPAYY
ncbi:unnamed protein product [Phytophthora fragariaefolia]|uniref:Unnamed protein product n=1 Tax=Phytophthora fragariaefolia TaxID=1490495 RepID=A0A9W6XHT1_9STRA|nr:unnamed protein product [Phytophthora fragariaefolia]